jgi:hypothetical protein
MVIDRCFSIALAITGSDISSTQQNCYDINLSGSCSKTYPLLLLPSCLLSLSLTLLWPWRQGRPSPTLGRRLTTYPRRPPPPTGASASFWPPPPPQPLVVSTGRIPHICAPPPATLARRRTGAYALTPETATTLRAAASSSAGARLSSASPRPVPTRPRSAREQRRD